MGYPRDRRPVMRLFRCPTQTWVRGVDGVGNGGAESREKVMVVGSLRVKDWCVHLVSGSFSKVCYVCLTKCASHTFFFLQSLFRYIVHLDCNCTHICLCAVSVLPPIDIGCEMWKTQLTSVKP